MSSASSPRLSHDSAIAWASRARIHLRPRQPPGPAAPLGRGRTARRPGGLLRARRPGSGRRSDSRASTAHRSRLGRRALTGQCGRDETPQAAGPQLPDLGPPYLAVQRVGQPGSEPGFVHDSHQPALLGDLTAPRSVREPSASSPSGSPKGQEVDDVPDAVRQLAHVAAHELAQFGRELRGLGPLPDASHLRSRPDRSSPSTRCRRKSRLP